MRAFILSLVAILVLVATVLANPLPSEEDALEKRSSSGRGTWYYPGLGNCGQWDKRNATVIALATKTYAKGAHCNKYIKITANGKTAYGKIRDSCVSCGPNDIDMGPELFRRFAPLSKGVIKVTWSYAPKYKP